MKKYFVYLDNLDVYSHSCGVDQMEQSKQKDRIWLPHLKNSIPKEAYGHSISMYCVALEGWRRGLNLTFRNFNTAKSNTVYFLSDGKKEHRFVVTKGDKVTDDATLSCNNKYLTKKILLKAGVPTPEGKVFYEDSNDVEIVKYANKLGYPVVIKPLKGSGGKGVIANIRNEIELKKTLTHLRQELNIKNIIVEKHFEGIDCRVYVLDGKVIGAIKRLPANVIGDGKSTIETLINLKQKARFNNPALYGRKIKIDKEVHQVLKQQNYTLDSIPKQGEMVLLKTKNNVSAGGDAIDITDELTDKVKEIALNAANAIPGLVQCGVDLMVDFENDNATVIEINSQPHIASQLFPEKGKGRNIPKAIIDYYFPETKANYNEPLYYFDFGHVWKLFRKGFVKEISIPNVPKGNLKTIKLIISGKVQSTNFSNWIKQLANKYNLNGFLKYLNNGDCQIITSGQANSVDMFKKIVTEESYKIALIEDIKEEPYKEPIKIGFEIFNENKRRTQKKHTTNHLKNKNKHSNNIMYKKKNGERVFITIKRLIYKLLNK